MAVTMGGSWRNYPAISRTNDRNADAVSSSREICRAIKETDAALRKQYPFLNHQDLIGAIIFTSSLLLISLFSYLYLNGYISSIPTIVLIALPISLLHELEHDIIHNLYFKKQRWFQNLMFIFIWIAKLHVSPWYRRQLHLKHHLLSGQTNDVEERLIGLGLSPNYERMAVSIHPFGGVLISEKVYKDAKYPDVMTMIKNAPMALIFLFITRTFLTYNLLFFIYSYFGYDIGRIYGIHTLYPIIHSLAICLCFPNLLRQGSLVLMSNASHYYGDIPLNTVYYQNQILDSWYVFPFQLFCFNFGATHIIHHYIVSQPFYIRHFTARAVKDMMVKLGVRNNDFGILWRSNRYTIDAKEDEKQILYGKCWFAACLLLGFPLYILWDMMVIHKEHKTMLKLIRKKLSKRNTKEIDNNIKNELIADKKMADDNNDGVIDSDINKLNTLVNRMALYDVSADQVEEVGDAAVEA
jgi:fatty acid desaturase